MCRAHGTLCTHRSVVITLGAFDETATHSGATITWATQAVAFDDTNMQPPGCFECTAAFTNDVGTRLCPAAVGVGGTTASLSGRFTTPGACVIGTAAISGLPTSTDGVTKSPSQPLTVTLQVPLKLAIVGALNEGTSLNTPNFTKLWGRTHGGQAAAVIGVGSSLTIRVVDSTGATVTGDSHTQISAVGTRSGGTNVTGSVRWTIDATMNNGETVFSLATTETTRTGTCDAMAVLTSTDVCEHAPWTFDVSATVTATDGQVLLFESLTQIGPLYFVKRAQRMAAFANLGLPCVDPTLMPQTPKEWEQQGALCVPSIAPTAVSTLRDQGFVPLALNGGVSGVDGHTGRAALGSTHPASVAYGQTFDVEFLALGSDGTLITHPEDVGSRSVLTIRPLVVPCINVDNSSGGAWLTSTCAQTPGALCAWDATQTAYMQCNLQASSGWSLPQNTVNLVGGRASFSTVGYGGASGLARYLLSTTEFNYGWGAGVVSSNPSNLFMAPDDEFLFEMDFQTPVDVLPYNVNGVSWSCTNDTCDSTGVPIAEPQVTIFLPIQIRDAQGVRVNGDYAASVEVTGVCTDVNPAVKSFFAFQSAAGMGLTYIAIPLYDAVRGVSIITGLLATAPCGRLQVNVACVACVPQFTRTLYMQVGTPAPPTTAIPPGSNATLVPLPPPPPVLVLSGMSLGSFSTETEALSSLTTMKESGAVAVAEARMLALLTESNPVCLLSLRTTRDAHVHTGLQQGDTHAYVPEGWKRDYYSGGSFGSRRLHRHASPGGHCSPQQHQRHRFPSILRIGERRDQGVL